MNIPIDISDVTIQSPRLLLRFWKQDDLADLYEYASVDGVCQMAGWKPHQSMEKSARVLSMLIREKKTFAVEYEGKVIGSLGIELYDEKQIPELHDFKGRELSFVLAKDYWGQGLMPEAVKAVIEWFFTHTDGEFLTCGHFIWNRQSKRVQEKCGFHFLKKILFETKLDTIEKINVNILWRQEWEDAKKRADHIDQSSFTGITCCLC